MNVPLIGIVIGTTRKGRFSEVPARWIEDIARRRTDLEVEILDLRDFALPLLEVELPPSAAPIDHPEVKRWSSRVAALDGFVFVTGEYNHSVPAVLKNAIDSAYGEFNRKAATYVSYGTVGGARAVEHLRQIGVELQLASTRAAVHIGVEAFIAIVREGKTLADFDALARSADIALEELAWWALTLKAGRNNGADASQLRNNGGS